MSENPPKAHAAAAPETETVVETEIALEDARETDAISEEAAETVPETAGGDEGESEAVETVEDSVDADKERAAEVLEKLKSSAEEAGAEKKDSDGAGAEAGTTAEAVEGGGPEVAIPPELPPEPKYPSLMKVAEALRPMSRAAGYASAGGLGAYVLSGTAFGATWGVGAGLTAVGFSGAGAVLGSAAITGLGALWAVAWPVALGGGFFYFLHKLPDLLEQIAKGDKIKLPAVKSGSGGGHAKPAAGGHH